MADDHNSDRTADMISKGVATVPLRSVMTGKGASRFATAKAENFEGVEANPGRIGVGSRIMLTSNQCGWARVQILQTAPWG